jgi:methionyl-tRNA formyltransferase
MKIVIIGQKDIAKDLLKFLINRGENVVAVFGPKNNNNKKDSLIEFAKENKIPNFEVSLLNNDEAKNFYKSLNADICLMAYVTELIPSTVLKTPKFGTIQYHPSLLPYNKGPSAISWAIAQGKKETGVTIFWPDKKLDNGDIFLTKKCNIDENDTLKTIFFKKLYPLIIEAMIEALDLIKMNKISKVKQKSEGSYEGWFTKDLAEINWNKSVNEVHNLIRATDSVPGAWSKIKGYEINLFSTIKFNKKSQPGMLMSISEEGALISTKDGSVLIKEMKIENKQKTSSSELLKELGIKVGDKFDNKKD